MKKVLGLILGVSACALMISCATGEEAAGDKAYDMAKKVSGDAKRTQLKTAYINYDRAVKKNPDKISTRLRERYLDMAITRVQMVLDEGSFSMDAIPLLMSDIEDQLSPEVPADLRQRYAAFVVQMGDSCVARTKFIDALSYYDKAIEKAADPTPFRDKRTSVIRNVAEENYELAMMEFEMGQSEKDESKFIRAEYFAKVALHFDSTFDKAQKLLSDVRKLNRATYSAFVSVVDDYSDTLVFKKINNRDILFAIPDYKIMGGNAVAIVHMYNYSFNHLRMKSSDFSLEDVNGNRYPALAGKMDPDILEYEKEAQYTLRFPAPKAAVKRLVYENGPHISDKYFF